MPEGRRFKRGDPSQNPGGRPKGIAAYIRELTNDGRTIADILVSVLVDTGIDPKKRIDAATVLLDRGWGKAEQTTVVRTHDDFIEMMKVVDAAVVEVFGVENRDMLDANILKRLETIKLEEL